MYNIKNVTRSNPGMIEPTNNRPTGTPITSPKSINIILGGMICPNVPDAAIVPDAKDAE